MVQLTSEKNATRGKLHEGLLGYYLENGIDDINNYGFPERPDGNIERLIFHESENLEFTHRTIVAAEATNFILTKHIPNIKKIYWTSNPNDVSVLLGYPERNPSDLVAILENDNKIGISVKLKHRNSLTNKANKGGKETDEMFDICTHDILSPYRMILYDEANSLGIKIPSKFDSFLRNNEQLKHIDKKLKIEGYTKLADIIRSKLVNYDGKDFARLIRQGIGIKKPSIPVYELITIDRKNSLEHTFVESYEESERILEIHIPYLKLKPTKGRSLTITGKDEVLICRIDVNSRSSSILSPIQFRWFAWGKEVIK